MDEGLGERLAGWRVAVLDDVADVASKGVAVVLAERLGRVVRVFGEFVVACAETFELGLVVK